MTILELQNQIKDRLNAVEALVQGGCKAFAEDTRTVYDESAQCISSGKVAIVIVTPDFTRNGVNADGSFPCEARLMIRCSEKPPLSGGGGVAPRIRALDAAHVIAKELSRGAGPSSPQSRGATASPVASPALHFDSIRQTASTDRSGNTVITATVTFLTTINL